ncbi:hypothetical protein ACWKSP_33405 [Micromonosporaceae bacterium Da 78-11]
MPADPPQAPGYAAAALPADPTSGGSRTESGWTGESDRANDGSDRAAASEAAASADGRTPDRRVDGTANTWGRDDRSTYSWEGDAGATDAWYADDRTADARPDGNRTGDSQASAEQPADHRADPWAGDNRTADDQAAGAWTEDASTLPTSLPVPQAEAPDGRAAGVRPQYLAEPGATSGAVIPPAAVVPQVPAPRPSMPPAGVTPAAASLAGALPAALQPAATPPAVLPTSPAVPPTSPAGMPPTATARLVPSPSSAATPFTVPAPTTPLYAPTERFPSPGITDSSAYPAQTGNGSRTVTPSRETEAADGGRPGATPSFNAPASSGESPFAAESSVPSEAADGRVGQPAENPPDQATPTPGWSAPDIDLPGPAGSTPYTPAAAAAVGSEGYEQPAEAVRHRVERLAFPLSRPKAEQPATDLSGPGQGPDQPIPVRPEHGANSSAATPSNRASTLADRDASERQPMPTDGQTSNEQTSDGQASDGHAGDRQAADGQAADNRAGDRPARGVDLPAQRTPMDGLVLGAGPDSPAPGTNAAPTADLRDRPDAVRLGAHAAPYMDADGTLHNLRPIARLEVSGPDAGARRNADSGFGGLWFAAKPDDEDEHEAPPAMPAAAGSVPGQRTDSSAAAPGTSGAATPDEVVRDPDEDQDGQSPVTDAVTPDAGVVMADQDPQKGDATTPPADGHLVIDLDVTDLFGPMARAGDEPAATDGASPPTAVDQQPNTDQAGTGQARPDQAGPDEVGKEQAGADQADRGRESIGNEPAAETPRTAAEASAAGTTRDPAPQTTNPQAEAVRTEAVRIEAAQRKNAPTPEPVRAEPLRGRPTALSAADLEAIRWRLDGGTLREVVDNRDALRELGERLDGPLADEADNVVKAGLLSVRAEVYRLLGELGMAAAASRLALAHAEAARDVQSTVIAQAELAHVLRLRGDFTEADRLFARASGSTVPEALRSVVHENAGRSCFDQGRHMEALDHFARAVRLGPAEDTELAARVGVCLQAVYIHVLRDGWGPYPRLRQDILGVTAPAEPDPPVMVAAEPDAFGGTTAEQPVIHRR